MSGDLRPELLVTANQDNSVVVLSNDGAGAFVAAASISVDSPGAAAIGDFDGDGTQDVVVARESLNSVLTILRNDGTGSLEPLSTTSVHDNPLDLAVADFNGDGHQDVAIAHNLSLENVSILFGRGDGSFEQPIRRSVHSALRTLAAADVDRDGDPDLAGTRSGWVVVLDNVGDGRFERGAAYSVDDIGSETRASLADLDGDGDLDLVSSDFNAETLTLIRNDGGAFFPAVSFHTGIGPEGIAVLDLDGDGAPELATAGKNDDVFERRGIFALFRAEP